MPRTEEVPGPSPSRVAGAADPADEPVSTDRVRADLVDGRYELVERLGAGAMGVVYRANDVSLGRRVAIKVIDPERARSPAFIEMFKTEARALAQVRHENVVQVYTFGPYSDSFYLAMEHVDGTDLETLIEVAARSGEQFTVDSVVKLVGRVGLGLDAVHARGLVHRDVKPSNILVENGACRPVLVDFGLAQPSRLASSLASGTPQYMPPEQVRGLPVDHKADVYALACTTFELLAGRAIFEHDEPSEILIAQVMQSPPMLSSLRPELRTFDAVLERALAKDPRVRQGSAAAFVEQLEAAAQRLPRRVASAIRRSPGLPAASAVRVLICEGDEGLRRQLVRTVENVVGATELDVHVRCVASVSELASVADATTPELVILDDGTLGAAVASVVDTFRSDPRPEVLVLRASHDRVRGDASGARELAKPINAHVLGSVLTQMVRRILERRPVATAER